MSDVELVIKIPEEQYKFIKEGMSIDKVMAYPALMEDICEHITNGTPLPKGHKRLIEDNFEVGPVFDEEGNRIGYQYVTQEDLNNAQTIIEEDKGSES